MKIIDENNEGLGHDDHHDVYMTFGIQFFQPHG